MLAKIDHVQLAIPAGGEDQARAFYIGVLGMTERVKPPLLAVRGGCWFRSGDQPGAVEIHVGVEDPFVPARKAHPGLLVHDVDELAGVLAEHGYAVRWDESVPGLRRFHSDDAHGNRLEFIQA
jgi:catechol 2,3-dioxygenase-like lactoylglutathione lyase family enzyme